MADTNYEDKYWEAQATIDMTHEALQEAEQDIANEQLQTKRAEQAHINSLDRLIETINGTLATAKSYAPYPEK